MNGYNNPDRPFGTATDPGYLFERFSGVMPLDRWEARRSRIPERMLRTVVSELNPGTQAAWGQWLERVGTGDTGRKRLREQIHEGRGATIAGITGAGKTRLACLIAGAMATTEIWPVFLSAATIRTTIFADFAAGEKLIRSATKKNTVLIMDDLGKGAPSPQADEVIFSILDDRSNACLPTIITTQYSAATLKARFKEIETADGALRRIGKEFNDMITL